MRLAASLALVLLVSSCVVEGRCVVELAPGVEGVEGVKIDVKVGAGAQLVDPKETSQALDALSTLGSAAIKAVLALIL